jgi:UDP-N-acetylglucosamine 2-epimerase (non-hydrolysing)
MVLAQTTGVMATAMFFRTEAIKLAPVIKRLESEANIESIVCVTAQHRQMLDQVLDVFKIKPDYDLDIMRNNQDLFSITARILSKLKEIIKKIQPHVVLVQGDTTTTFAASLAAFYLKTRVGHIEAGLRTYDKYAPFPEEVNRQLTSVIADFNFAPTDQAADNLLKEGIQAEKIFVTGNTVIDALYYILSATEISHVLKCFKARYSFLRNGQRLILITGHRRESFGKGFRNICTAICKLAKVFPNDSFVYPVHLNPNVQKPVAEILNNQQLPNIHLIEPLEYLSFVCLMRQAYLILTDSGGVQEEAIAMGKPILVMRDITERPEGVQVGAARLVGNNQKRIFYECKKLLESRSEYQRMMNKQNPYGDGKASEKIVRILKELLDINNKLIQVRYISKSARPEGAPAVCR